MGTEVLAAGQMRLELPLAFLGTGSDGQNGKRKGGEDEDEDEKVAVALTKLSEAKVKNAENFNERRVHKREKHDCLPELEGAQV